MKTKVQVLREAFGRDWGQLSLKFWADVDAIIQAAREDGTQEAHAAGYTAGYRLGFEEGTASERVRALVAIESEPELPGEMPAEVVKTIDKVGLEETLRTIVRLTKEGIIERFAPQSQVEKKEVPIIASLMFSPVEPKEANVTCFRCGFVTSPPLSPCSEHTPYPKKV